eukprot:TRINITY_DN10852_c0_g1_i2.p2 TRINITY_DN10852_c0_g1~~TRINITY_DN10852_c0_g1_i2.p2  ORF type:complete len:126 (+),score=24.57 TRINITY_DN10852_c0_g1_i2:130-507(+)
MCIRDSWSIVHPDSLKMAYREVGKVTLGQQKYARLQGRVLQKNGEYSWWHGHLQMVRKAQTQGLMGVVVKSGDHPVPRQKLVEMDLEGFPKNIDPGHLVKAFAWARNWDNKQARESKTAETTTLI